MEQIYSNLYGVYWYALDVIWKHEFHNGNTIHVNLYTFNCNYTFIPLNICASLFIKFNFTFVDIQNVSPFVIVHIVSYG